MASYGVRIVLPLPTAGSAQWDGPLGDLISAIVDVLAAQVTPAGISITSALDMGGNALIDCADIAFKPGSDTGAINTIFVAGSGQSGLVAGEWYLRDTSNRLIQLTSGGQVNVAGSAGFGGDYASATQVARTPIAQYNASNGSYQFTTDGSTLAIVSAGTVDVPQLVVTGLTQLSGSVLMTGSVAISATGSMSLSGSTYFYGSVTGSAVQQVKWDVSGRYLGRQIFASNQTYTPSKGCTNIVIRMCGGGGGGGGATNATQTSAGGGGSAGAYVETLIALTSATGSFVRGASAAGGSSAGGDGADGGDSIFFVNGTHYVAKGGLGGTGGFSAFSGSVAPGGGLNAGSTGVSPISTQDAGEPGWSGGSISGLRVAVSGRGGSTPFGYGGGGIAVSLATAGADGNSASGPGGGGGGATSGNSGGGHTGGGSFGGQLVIDEYR